MKPLAGDTGPHMCSRRPARTGCNPVIVSVLVVLNVGACGGATAPAESSGELLSGTGGVNCSLSEPFSFSPDRRWLAFAISEQIDPTSPPQDRIALSDLGSGQTFLPQPDEQAAARIHAGQPPGAGRLCWAEDSRMLYLVGSALPAGESVAGQPGAVAFREGRRPQPNWFAVELPEAATLTTTRPVDCAETGPRQWRFGSPGTETAAISRGLTVERPSDRKVRLVLPDGSLLAEHRTQRLLSTQAGIMRYIWSPDGQYLAYVVQEGVGTWGGLSRTFTIGRADPASAPRQLMTGPVYALGWRDNQALYACIRDSEQNRTAIYRWRLDNRQSTGMKQ